MDDVLATDQALARWIDANGYGSTGYAREVTVEWSPDPDDWVTELQQPIFVDWRMKCQEHPKSRHAPSSLT